MNRKLSILICHMKEREGTLMELMDQLEDQLNDDVEVILDSRPGISVGAKRNALLDQSVGKYIAFVDDDDNVSGVYVRDVLRAIEEKPDVVGMRGYLMQQGSLRGIFEHSLKHEKWADVDGPGALKWVRPPNHLNPVKRELAMQARFPEKSYGEDQDYSMKLRPLLHTETMIETPIYLYVVRMKPGENLRP